MMDDIEHQEQKLEHEESELDEQSTMLRSTLFLLEILLRKDSPIGYKLRNKYIPLVHNELQQWLEDILDEMQMEKNSVELLKKKRCTVKK